MPTIAAQEKSQLPLRTLPRSVGAAHEDEKRPGGIQSSGPHKISAVIPSEDIASRQRSNTQSRDPYILHRTRRAPTAGRPILARPLRKGGILRSCRKKAKAPVISRGFETWVAQVSKWETPNIFCLWVAQRFHRCDKVAKVQAASAAEVPSMAAPPRGNTGHSCYFITASAFQKRNILQSDRMAALLVDVLLHYRAQRRYLLHEFVVMPDHFHLLITPRESLERAMQLIKGGFSFRSKRELRFMHEIWQPSFYDRRVRDAEEYFALREYIRQNAVKRGLAVKAEGYQYSSAWPGFVLDEAPRRLKPLDSLSA
jgi:putative transposase